jgi:hypothetical protein
MPVAYFDVTFFDWSVFSDESMLKLERDLHDVLFPNVPFDWLGCCAATGVDAKSPPSGLWRNAKCDVQAIWAHVHNRRDVFVTTDSNFHKHTKKGRLVALGAGAIKDPGAAAKLIV